MAKAKQLKAEAYIRLSKTESVLWYTIDENGNITWHLPKDKAAAYKQAMLESISENFSLYLANHPEASLRVANL